MTGVLKRGDLDTETDTYPGKMLYRQPYEDRGRDCTDKDAKEHLRLP